MFKSLELRNELTIGVDAPIGRIIERFATAVLNKFFEKDPDRKNQLKIPDGFLIIENFAIIQKNLRESIFTLIDYDQYALLEEPTRLAIKTKLADTLINAFINPATFNQFETTNNGKEFSIVLPLEFFETDRLKRLLQSECDTIKNSYLNKPTPETLNSLVKNTIKSFFRINNSPEAFTVANKGEELMLPNDKIQPLLNSYSTLQTRLQGITYTDSVIAELEDKFMTFYSQVNSLNSLYPQELLTTAQVFLTYKFQTLQGNSNPDPLDSARHFCYNHQTLTNIDAANSLHTKMLRLVDAMTDFKSNSSLKSLRVVKMAADEVETAFSAFENKSVLQLFQ
jgi:hypothetical protein